MPRHIAFLRAINVGGHTVRMERLRALFGDAGFERAETFIASGNVIFDADQTEPSSLELELEQHLRRALGFDVATFIRSPYEVRSIARHRPFGGDEGGSSSLYVAFLKAPPSPAAELDLLARRCDLDDFHTQGREVYWLCRARSSESTFSGTVLERILGAPATIRKTTTLARLAAKFPPTDVPEGAG